MALDGAVLSDAIKLALETKMEAEIGQPYLDAKADMDGLFETISHAVGEEVVIHVEPEIPDDSYTPATSGDWAGDPTTIPDALDRLAAAVAGLLGNPVP